MTALERIETRRRPSRRQRAKSSPTIPPFRKNRRRDRPSFVGTGRASLKRDRKFRATLASGRKNQPSGIVARSIFSFQIIIATVVLDRCGSHGAPIHWLGGCGKRRCVSTVSLERST